MVPDKLSAHPTRVRAILIPAMGDELEFIMQLNAPSDMSF